MRKGTIQIIVVVIFAMAVVCAHLSLYWLLTLLPFLTTNKLAILRLTPGSELVQRLITNIMLTWNCFPKMSRRHNTGYKSVLKFWAVSLLIAGAIVREEGGRRVVVGGGTLIGVKNYKSLVKSGETVHWATLHCLQLPELLQQLPLNRRQVQWTAINSLKVPSSFFVQNFQY